MKAHTPPENNAKIVNKYSSTRSKKILGRRNRIDIPIRNWIFSDRLMGSGWYVHSFFKPKLA